MIELFPYIPKMPSYLLELAIFSPIVKSPTIRHFLSAWNEKRLFGIQFWIKNFDGLNLLDKQSIYTLNREKGRDNR